MEKIFFKIKNNRKLKKQLKIVNNINNKYSKHDLNKLRDLFIKEIDNDKEMISILSEISFRILGLRPYKEQLIGVLSIAINGYLVEMKTGEGKTLTAGLAALLRFMKNSKSGKKVFVLTVNEYLSKRDLEYSKKLFDFFNISSASLSKEDNIDTRKEKYRSDILYGTASDFVFDYLRDNTIQNQDLIIYPNRKFDSIIIDEIDSILIDESSTPLIISSENKYQNNNLIIKSNEIVSSLKSIDIIINKKEGTVLLTEDGISKVENLFNIKNLFDIGNIEYLHRIEESLLAVHIYTNNKDYIVENGKIILIDQSTGRLSYGRQMSYGLHQAIEAKEGVNITYENIAIAKTTYQDFFNKFKYLTGMTGTAKTEEKEFLEIYGLEIIVIPTHKKMIREDLKDRVFLNNKSKVAELIKEVSIAHKKGQPILIGTTNVEENEYLSNVLKKNDFKFQQLNAKNVAKEADIIKNAGEYGSITLATNMAGRGVDIKVSDESLLVGGLFVIGFGRYDNRRIDNQLRGRSGRQGNVGKSLFLVSLQDSLIKEFTDSNIFNVIKNMNLSENDLIESTFVSKAIEKAQISKENTHFELRKNLMKFDSVLSIQRNRIYDIRNNLLSFDKRELFFDKLREIILHLSKQINFNSFEELKIELKTLLNISIEESNYPENPKQFIDFVEYVIFNKFSNIDNEIAVEILKNIYLKEIDNKWSLHINLLEEYQSGIDSVKLAQKDPLVEYQKKSFLMFQNLLSDISKNVLYKVFNINFEIKKVDINKIDIS